MPASTDQPGTADAGSNLVNGRAELVAGGWFTELSSMWPGQGLSIQIEEILFKQRSQFQVRWFWLVCPYLHPHLQALLVAGCRMCAYSAQRPMARCCSWTVRRCLALLQPHASSGCH